MQILCHFMLSSKREGYYLNKCSVFDTNISNIRNVNIMFDDVPHLVWDGYAHISNLTFSVVQYTHYSTPQVDVYMLSSPIYEIDLLGDFIKNIKQWVNMNIDTQRK